MPITSDTMGRLNDVYSSQPEGQPPKPEIKWISAVQNIEQEIEVGIFIFDGLKRNCEAVQSRIDSGELPYETAITETFAMQFRNWLTKGESILEEVDTFEQNHVVIKNASELRDRMRMIRLQNFDMAQMKKADENEAAGRTMSLTEALDAVRARCRS